MGYPESAIVCIVIAECTLVVLYLVPQTSVLAAIVMNRLPRRRGGHAFADSQTRPARRFPWS